MLSRADNDLLTRVDIETPAPASPWLNETRPEEALWP